MSRTASGKKTLGLSHDCARERAQTIDDGWQRLANDIVEMAMRDYAKRFARVLVIDEHPEFKEEGCFRETEEKIITREMNEILDWFDSPMFSLITELTREDAMAICDDLIDEEKKRQELFYAKKYKRLKKLHGETVVYLEVGRNKDSSFFQERVKRV